MTSIAYSLEIIVGLPYGKHKIGHTAVRVKMNNGQDVIYDFGRYGKVWGPLKMQGEGLMRVWRGDEESQYYIKKQRSYRSSIGYVIDVTKQEEAAIFEYYEGLLKKAKWTKPGHKHTRYRLARDYDGVFTQCTSIALEGIKKVWPKEKWERILHPKFNIGQGFNKKVRSYYFKKQKKHERFETVVPLDVIDSFKAELKREPSFITKVIDYPQRQPVKKKK